MSRDEPLLLDMLTAARDAAGFVAGMSEGEFRANRLHQAAVIRCLEVIGEAASKVSAEYRVAHAEIEWREIVGIRHRLIHNYGAIRLDVVWNAVRDKIPALIGLLDGLVPPEDEIEPWRP